GFVGIILNFVVVKVEALSMCGLAAMGGVVITLSADSLSAKHQRAIKGLVECKASVSNLRRIQVNDIVKEVKDYLKTYSSARMDISCGGSHVTNVYAFDKEDFPSWKVWFLVFLDGLEPYLLKTLEDGPFVPLSSLSTFDNPLPKRQNQWSNVERRLANQDKRLKNIIISCLPNDIMKSIIKCKTVKAIWNDLILAYERPSDRRDTKIAAFQLKFNASKSLERMKVNGTFTRLKCLLNDLENNGVIIPQAEIYESETQRFTIHVSSSKALISNNQFQDTNSNVEEDQRSNNEFMADLNAEYHERSLLAYQKRFYKRSWTVGSARKPIDKSKETCFTCGITKIKAFMAIAKDKPSIGKANARSSYKFTLDQLLSKQIPGTIVKALGGRGKRKEKISSKEVIFNKADESSSMTVPEITLDSESKCETQEHLLPLFKLIRTAPAGTSTKKAPMIPKPFKNCIYYGFNYHHFDNYEYYPECEYVVVLLMNQLTVLRSTPTAGNQGLLTSDPHNPLKSGFTKETNLCENVYARILKEESGPKRKFDEKADDGFFLGYSLVAKAFRVFNIRRQEMEETFHVTFSEDDEAISQTSIEGDAINFNENRSLLNDEFLEPRNKVTQCSGNIEYFPFIPGYETILENIFPTDLPLLQDSVSPEEPPEFTSADDHVALND
nr:hypothetical protein [Tanacetum cinerariifolium]